MNNISIKTKKTAQMGFMLGIIFVLGIAESYLIPPSAINIRPGLSNVVIMYSLFFMGKKDAITLNILKSLFVLITRGAMAWCLSLTGGLLSIGAMVFLRIVFKEKISLYLLSIFGAAAHNFGQVFAACLLLGNFLMMYYIPIQLIYAILTGSLTGILLKSTLPYLKRVKR